MTGLFAQVKHYAKAHTATVFAVSAWYATATADNKISGIEWLGLVIALAGGGAVAAVRNGRKPQK